MQLINRYALAALGWLLIFFPSLSHHCLLTTWSFLVVTKLLRNLLYCCFNVRGKQKRGERCSVYYHEDRPPKGLSTYVAKHWKTEDRRVEGRFMMVSQVPEKEQLSIKWTISVEWVPLQVGYFYLKIWLKWFKKSKSLLGKVYNQRLI